MKKEIRRIIELIITAENDSDINHICGEIDRAFQAGKITWSDNELLYDLVAKVSYGYRKGVKHYKKQ